MSILGGEDFYIRCVTRFFNNITKASANKIKILVFFI